MKLLLLLLQQAAARGQVGQSAGRHTGSDQTLICHEVANSHMLHCSALRSN
jgi:hypothetical protein